MQFRNPIWLAIAFVIVIAAGVAIGFHVARSRPDATSATSHAASGLQLSPTPKFVVDREIPAETELTANRPNGVRILLLDQQHDATRSTRAFYVRMAMKAETAAGVQGISQQYILYDPILQKLALNHARVSRDGNTEDRSRSVEATFAQRETLAELQVLTGATTAILRIPDVRQGDIVDIAYTLTDEPVVVGQKDARLIPLAFAEPVESFSVRSIWPSAVSVKAPPMTPEPTTTAKGGKTVVSVEPRSLAGNDLDALSVMTTPDAALMLSGYRSWEEVARWGTPLFQPDDPRTVADIVTQLNRDHQETPVKVVAAARFVQNEILYSAQLLGAGGYLPQTVAETLRTRRGDCKAKTILFLTILRSLGVNASAALVNRAEGMALDAFAPAPLAFDHVIAGFDLDGRNYWIDLTQSHQGGDLRNFVQPDYGLALPLKEGSSFLVSMARPKDERPDIELEQTFDLRNGFQAGSADATLKLRGRAADTVRATIAFSSQKAYLDTLIDVFRPYGGVELSAATITDDLEANEIVVAFGANLTKPFAEPDRSGRRFFRMPAHYVAAVIPDFRNKEPQRAAPLMHTLSSVQRTTLKMPKGFEDIGPQIDHQLSTAAFDYEAHGERLPTSYRHEVSFRPVARFVQPKDYQSVLTAQGSMLETKGFNIWIHEDVGVGPQTNFDPVTDLQLPAPPIEAPK